MPEPRKITIRVTLSPDNPLDKVVMEELERHRKRAYFLKFAAFCYIQGIGIKRDESRTVGTGAPPKEADPEISRAILEVESIEP